MLLATSGSLRGGGGGDDSGVVFRFRGGELEDYCWENGKAEREDRSGEWRLCITYLGFNV